MAVLNKFDPSKTLYFRGFSAIDCPAAIHSASSTVFTLSQVFRQADDFSVLVIFDIDDYFNHPLFKPLPDGDLTGVVLEFDMAADPTVFATLDRAKFPTIDFPFVDFILQDGSAGRIDISHNNLQSQLLGSIQAATPGSNIVANTTATTISAGGLTPASVTITVNVPSGGMSTSDEISLWFQNNLFYYLSLAGGESALTVAQNLVASLTGGVQGNGINDSLSAGAYTGSIYGIEATVGAHTSTTAEIVITAVRQVPTGGSSFTTITGDSGPDGNLLALYWYSNDASVFISQTSPVYLAGGSSSATFHVTLDFGALATASGLDLTHVRQLWLTFAPLIPNDVPALAPALLDAVNGVAGDAVFSNWRLSADPGSKAPLSVAGPGSVRIEETDAWTKALGTWNPTNVGWFSQGFAIWSNTVGDSLTITYWCPHTHALWLGTSLYSDRGKFGVTLDGAAQPDLDMMTVTYPLGTGATVGTPSTGSAISEAYSTRRELATGITAGQHTVVLTVKAGDTPPSSIGSSYGYCYFDFLEACVSSDVPAPQGPWTDRGISTDFDTQHGYQLCPARLLWMMDQLGFQGDIDHYLGVFWWSNRQIAGRVLGYVTIDFSAIFASIIPSPSTGIFVDIGGTTIGKSVLNTIETAATWAMHFSVFINEAFTGVVATYSGSLLTITARGPVTATSTAFAFSFSAYYDNGSGPVAITPGGIGFTSLSIAAGLWQIDPTQAAITYPVSQWHADYFAEIQSRSMKVAAAFSLELVYPPDVNTVGNVWVARSSNGVPILTDTGFGSYLSSQCAPGAVSFIAYQKAAYLAVAALMSGAGLTPYMQCGEFLWWFFSSLWLAPIGSVAILSFVRLGFADPHGCAAGDTIRVANLQGIPSVNGTWSIVAVPDATHMDITAPYSGGTWVTGTGLASGGSMAYYDAETAADASTALGHPLGKFTFPDDNPAAVDGGADATFLANRLAAHVAAIIAYVQTTYPGAVFEILFPNDVNGPTVTPVTIVGGALNAFVNFPVSWQSAGAAPFTIFKLEQLAFGTTDRDMNLTKAGLARLRALAWPLDQLKYLYPVDNSGCPQWTEYNLAKVAGFTKFNPFAVDQICLIGWRVDPPEENSAQVF